MNKSFKILILTFFISIISCSTKKTTYNDRIETDGYYVVESVKDSNDLEKGYGLIRGQVFDEYTKKYVSNGFVIIDGMKKGAILDSLGNFEIFIEEGLYKLKFVSTGNKSFITDTIIINERTTTSLIIYLGTYIVY